MAYTVRITADADSNTAKKGDKTLAELAADLNLEASDLTAAIEAAIPVYLAALPTADPLSDGEFWLNSGVVTISAGDP